MAPGATHDFVNITRTFKRQNAKNLLIAVRLDCHPRERGNLGTPPRLCFTGAHAALAFGGLVHKPAQIAFPGAA
jgi:hypothetical protein